MRIMLVANPRSSAGGLPDLARVHGVLRLVGDVEVASTTHRGHARELASAARVEGWDAVVVFAGDGTVSEVVDGLLPDARPASGGGPVLGVVPGGAANVLARTLGQPRGVLRSAQLVANALVHESTRLLGLIRLEVSGPVVERWAVLNVGLGLDAEAIARVEAARRRGRRASGLRYTASTVRAWRALDRSTAPMTLRSPLGEVPQLPMVIATNTDPWSYLGVHRLRPTPRSSFDLGIDVSAPVAITAASTLGSVARMMTHRPGSPTVTYTAHDQPWVEVNSTRDVALQVDGDYLGRVRAVRLTQVPRALRVLTA